MESLHSFKLGSSKRQSFVEGMLLLIMVLLLWPLLSLLWAALLIVVAIGLWGWSSRQRQYRFNNLSIQLQAGRWWLLTPAPQLMQWRTGSVRRHQLIIWRYGRWPWQRLVIYPDALAAGEFQQLQRQLALNPL